MKKVLYGTTALVAAGFVAGEAQAAGGLKLGITGFYRNSIGAQFGNGVVNQLGGFVFPTVNGVAASNSFTAGYGRFNHQAVSMRQEIRVNFTGKTTLDNGITVGVLVGLNGENVAKAGSTTQINRAYADFSGKFGMVRIGEANSALLTECVVDPGNVTSNFGVNSPNESFSNVGKSIIQSPLGKLKNTAFGPSGPMASIGTCYGLEGKGNKLMYFSPSFGGFTFGVSFTPQGSSRIAGGNLNFPSDGTNFNGQTSPISNIVSVGADYQHDFGSWNLLVGGGAEYAPTQYTHFGSTNSSDRPGMYQGGFQVGFGPFAVGASGAYYQNYHNDGFNAQGVTPGDDAWVVTGGGSYTIDAWSFGLQGMYSSWQYGGNVDKEKSYAVSLNSAYALGPGISLEGQVAWTAADYGDNFGIFTTPPIVNGVRTAGLNGYVHAVEIDFGTAINF